MFLSIYGFIHALCLNSKTLCTFLNVNPWSKSCFNADMRTTYLLLSSNVVNSFDVLSTFLLSHKNGRSLWGLCSSLGYSMYTLSNAPVLLLSS